jgi:hypothetical protein
MPWSAPPSHAQRAWKQVQAPTAPEWRLLRADGTPVLVIRKRIETHERGSKLAVTWRRDGHVWVLWFAIVWTIVNAARWIQLLCFT